MKRKGNLYQNICKMNNILVAYNEICRNTKNKNRVANFREYKCIYLTRVYNILENKAYKPGPNNVFTIYEPKERRIVSQNMQDKLVNHLVARFILYPAIMPCLLDVNVASRKNLGTSEGLRLAQKFNRICKIRYENYYILKCDISKFFASIDHDILKAKIKRRIKDKDALKIVFDIIDNESQCLSIGSMCSQVLAIYFLHDMDCFIKEKLKIKYFVRYQDDFLLFHPDKKYLKYCLEEIKKFLEKEKLQLNSKTRIYKNTDNFIFLGRNKKGRYVRYRNVKRKLRKKYYLYKTNLIPLNSFVASKICYNSLCGKNIKYKKENAV